MVKRLLIAVVVLVAIGSAFLGVERLHARNVAQPQPQPGQIQRDVDGGAAPAPAQTVSPIASPSATPSEQRHAGGASAPQAQYLVLFVLDGAQPSYLNVPGIPHIRALMQGGTSYSNAWAGILESETPSGHASIASGSAPRHDGILSFGWAGDDNIPVNLFSPTKINNHDMENIVAGTHVSTIASLVHRTDPGAKVVALSGHKYYAADALGGPDADVIMYYQGTSDGKYAPTSVPGHTPPPTVLNDPSLTYKTTHLPTGTENHLVMQLAQHTFQVMHQKVTLINLPEFDWPLGHIWGAGRDPKDVTKMMQDFDSDLGQLEDLYRKAGILDKTLFVITSDHGMAPIYHTVDHDALTKAVSDAGTSIISDSYHTAAYMWVKDESRAPAAAANIAALTNPYIQSVYFKERTPPGFDYVRASGPELLRASGADVANDYLLSTFQGSNAPDIAVFFTEHAASLPLGEASWKGDHGGADWESQHVPLVISGPGVRHAATSAYPARLMDIAPTALTLMGIPVTGMDGAPLADAMQSASTSIVDTQRARGAELTPIVSSLQQEAQMEIAATQ